MRANFKKKQLIDLMAPKVAKGKNKRRGVNIHRKIRDEIRDRARENFGKI